MFVFSGSWKVSTSNFDAHWDHEPDRKMYLPLPTVFWGERETGRGGALPQTREVRLPAVTPEVRGEPPHFLDAR